MNIRKLEIALSKLSTFCEPKFQFEQWSTPGRIAAEILFEIVKRGDLTTVADFGCGTGTFAIGAALLGAKKVIAIDIDPDAISTAKENAIIVGVEIDFRVCDVFDFDERVHCVIQNPPFGTVTEKLDTAFLKKARSVSDVVYTLHAHPSASFINRVAGQGTEFLATYSFPLPATQSFHKGRHSVACDLWRITS